MAKYAQMSNGGIPGFFGRNLGGQKHENSMYLGKRDPIGSINSGIEAHIFKKNPIQAGKILV